MGYQEFHSPTAISIINEARGHQSREQITVKTGTGQVFADQILGAVVTSQTSTSSVKASGANTGTGTFVLDATSPVQPRGQIGRYTLRCIAAATNGGKFRLEDPDGVMLGDFTLPATSGGSVTISEQIKGVLTDGGTDFAVGDGFDILVTAIGLKYVPLAAAATDGSQIAAGILFRSVDATSCDQRTVAIVRAAEFDWRRVRWPDWADTNEKKTLIAQQLADIGIGSRL
jgi:hypothetical protein